MIIIHAYFKINLKNREDFLKQAKRIATFSQAEEGNISYCVFEDPGNTGEFVFIEKWKDETAVQQHEETTVFKAFVEQLPNYLVEPLKVEFFSAEAIKR